MPKGRQVNQLLSHVTFCMSRDPTLTCNLSDNFLLGQVQDDNPT